MPGGVLLLLMPPRAFEETVLPHLDAAFNYARWLTRNDAEAEDVVQEACVRAMRFFSSLRHEDARGWLLTIVRNTWFNHVSRRPNITGVVEVEDGRNDPADEALDPEAQLLQQYTIARVRSAIEELPTDFREVLVLREIEGLSYKDIAAIVRVPIGTVMSRLSRARERLLDALKPMEVLP